MATNTHTNKTSDRRISPLAIVLVPLIVAALVTLFAWPSSQQEPRDLPVAVAGTPAAAQALERQLNTHAGAFHIERYPDEASAREAIEDRDVYGAFVATPAGVKLLTASAASSVIAQTLTHAVPEGTQVQDVVAAPAEASGLSSSVFPLIFAGTATALAALALASTGLGRAGLLVTGSALGGIVGAVIIESWLGVVDGDLVANAGVLSLTIFAIAAFIGGSQALFGHVGGAVAGMTMVFVGNPFSGVASGPEMLPQPVGLIGQLMPPGAGGNLLRSTGFFDGAAASGHVAVLAVWAFVGLAALGFSALRQRQPAGVPVPVAA
jgi:hypothetical protein